MFTIEPTSIQNAARESMLLGHFENAKTILKESLVGINNVQIMLILEGNGRLISSGNGMSLENYEDIEYKKTLQKIKSNIENSANKRNEILKEELLKLYLKKHYEFVEYTTETRMVSFPKSLMDRVIGENADFINFNGFSCYEQLEILLPELSKENLNNLINDIKFFGYELLTDIKLFKENNKFGRLNGKIKKLEDKDTLSDTDILFIDSEERGIILNNFSYCEKAGAIIAYASMSKLMAHLKIFHNSKEDYEQVPLILISRDMKSKIDSLYKKEISINFKTNTVYKK